MENEKRLIDANALSEKIGIMKFEITRNRGGYRYCNEEEKNEWDKLDSFDSLVCDAPAVDAVPVVRCKDCTKFERKFPGYGYCYHWDYETGMSPNEVEEYDFCSYGERRAEDDEND